MLTLGHGSNARSCTGSIPLALGTRQPLRRQGTRSGSDRRAMCAAARSCRRTRSGLGRERRRPRSADRRRGSGTRSAPSRLPVPRSRSIGASGAGRTRPTAGGRSVSAPSVRRRSSQAPSNPATIQWRMNLATALDARCKQRVARTAGNGSAPRWSIRKRSGFSPRHSAGGGTRVDPRHHELGDRTDVRCSATIKMRTALPHPKCSLGVECRLI